MATTPEGVVKDRVKALLAKYLVLPASKAGAFPDTAAGWYFMPVPTGHGVSGVPDFIGHCFGEFFAVETKAPGKKPTQFQAMQHAALRQTGAAVFVVDGSNMTELETWLKYAGA